MVRDPEPLDVRIRREGARTLVALRGELDLASAPALLATAEADVVGARQLVVDLREVDFIDLSGLRAVATLHATASAAGATFVLIRGPRSVHRVFEMTFLDERLTFVGDPIELAQPA